MFILCPDALTLNGSVMIKSKSIKIIMQVNFYLKTKGIFPHDFTLIASVVGESVIGHGIGEKVSQLKSRDSLKSQSLE